MIGFLYELLENRSFKTKGYFFNAFIILLICLSVVCVILETDSDFNSKYYYTLLTLETGISTIFLFEYLARIYVSPYKYADLTPFKARLKFITSFGGIIDLLAISPFFLPFIVNLDLRILRLLRVFKITQILKVGRHSKSLKLIIEVIKEKRTELGITILFSFILIVISAYFIYFFEHEHQPEVFKNYLDAIWWAVATLTTIGYGDIYPITYIGRALATIVAFLGIGIIALPTGILGSAFIEKIQKRKEAAAYNNSQCPHCGKKLQVTSKVTNT